MNRDYENQTEKKSGGECYTVEQVTTIERATTIKQLFPWTVLGIFFPVSILVIWYTWRHTHPDIVDATKVGALIWLWTVIICVLIGIIVWAQFPHPHPLIYYLGF